MGPKSADTQREIELLRDDITGAAAELQRRLGVGPADQGSAGTPPGAKVAAVSARLSEPTLADRYRSNPQALAVVGVVAVGLAGYAAYTAIERWRESRKPQNQLRRKAERFRGDITERLETARKRAEEARKRGLLLKVDREGDEYLRVTGAKLDALDLDKGSRKDVVKNVLWAAMLALFMAVGGVLARRVAGGLWRLAIREDPPSEK